MLNPNSLNACYLIFISALTVACFCSQTASAAEREARSIEAQYTRDGADGCLRCHAGESMAVMSETAHGDENDPHAPSAKQGCESCHGPGSLHVSRARGGAGSPPLLRFRQDGDPLTEQTSACLSCHAEDMGEVEGMAWNGSLHDTGRITCSTCHTLHTAGNPMAEREPQQSNCARCHEEQIADHNRFENRGIVFDRLACHDCHDVHQLESR